jgi:hypothetical protein
VRFKVVCDVHCATQDGTSFAAPHVSGVLARFLESNPTASWSIARASLLCDATRDIVAGVDPTTPNLLLYVPQEGITRLPSVNASCPDKACPSGCGTSAQGRCADGYCVCSCFRTGSRCQTQVAPATALTGLRGTVEASTTRAASYFGQVRLSRTP